jgi:hypothetical protein
MQKYLAGARMEHRGQAVAHSRQSSVLGSMVCLLIVASNGILVLGHASLDDALAISS